jgi:hypothetical protein
MKNIFCYRIFFLLSWLSPLLGWAQIGGTQSFAFLDLPVNARQVGLGGYNITSSDRDVAMLTANPGLLTDSVQNYASFSYYGYYAGIAHNQFTYAHRFEKAGLWGISLQQLSYGDFDSYDQTGNYLGTFNARDVAVGLTHSRQIRYFSLGVTVKFVQSMIESYHSSGLLADIGGVFIHPEKDWKIGLAIRNVGFAFSNYTPSDQFEMPVNVQVGTTYRPNGMPFRFSFTLHHLNQFLNLATEDPLLAGKTDAFGQPLEQNLTFADKLSRHVALGSEIVLGKSLNLRVGYNFMNRREMTLDQRKGVTGFTFGAMVRIKRIEVAYSAARVHVVGSSHNVSIAINTKQIFAKKRVVN